MSARSEGRGPAAAPWQYAVASQGAGALSTLLFYPLDVVKTRFMAQDGTELRRHNGMRYQHVVPSVRTMVREEGVGSLFRGAHVAVGASALSWGAYMLVYRSVEARLHSAARQAELGGGLEAAFALPLSSFAASVTGNVAVAFAANPLWLVKHRMQLEEAARSAASERHYRHIVGGLQYAVRTDGLRSLWRGVSAQLLVGIPSAATFPLYEWMRSRCGGDGTPIQRALVVCGCSVVAKTMTTVLAHPLVLVKVRLQDAKRSADPLVKYESIGGACSVIMRREGWRGFYRGLMPALMQVVPRSAVQIALYEGFMKLRRTTSAA